VTRQVLIAGACRTAIGAFGGRLSHLSAVELGAAVIAEGLKRGGVPPYAVDEIVMGHVLQMGLGENPARHSAMKAGVPAETTAFTVNTIGGSSLKAVALGAQAIVAGAADVVVAGGMESTTHAPYLAGATRWGARIGDGTIVATMRREGLLDAWTGAHLGITADGLARRFAIGRAEQDAFASESVRRARCAIEAGHLRDEIVPLELEPRTVPATVIDVDELPATRPSADALHALSPVFAPDGTLTAGNASRLGDGAAAVLLAAEDCVDELGVEPLGRVRACASAGVDPRFMGAGSIAAVPKALARAGLSIDDVELIEAHEAFAAQALAVAGVLGLPPEITNVSGGAIALGDPIGATGCRILVTLLYGLRRLNRRTGLATLCSGGGQGIAMIVERAA